MATTQVRSDDVFHFLRVTFTGGNRHIRFPSRDAFLSSVRDAVKKVIDDEDDEEGKATLARDWKTLRAELCALPHGVHFFHRDCGESSEAAVSELPLLSEPSHDLLSSLTIPGTAPVQGVTFGRNDALILSENNE